MHEAINLAYCSIFRRKCIYSISGKLMDYDEPMKLMKTEGSLFGQLVKEYWSNLQTA